MVRDERVPTAQRVIAAAALAHPNIATVYALENFDGELCLVSEYVPGLTARELLDRGPLDLPTVLRVASDVARALVEKLRDDDAGPTSLPVKEPTAFWRIEVFDLRGQDRVVVRRYGDTIRLLHPVGHDYYTMLREKLYPLGDDVVCLPGHGQPCRIGEERMTNPFLNE